jgi:hypothetical protein
MSMKWLSFSLNVLELVWNVCKLNNGDNILPVIVLDTILTFSSLYPLIKSDFRLPPYSLTFNILLDMELPVI